MFTNDTELKDALLEHKIYSAWQFIEFTYKNIETVSYCYHTINNVINKMSMQTICWEQDLFSDFVEEFTSEGKKTQRVTITEDILPTYELRVVGEKIDPWFLFDKLVRDFFQYAMNAFDSISQIANAGLLANKGKKVDSVDFQRMVHTFAQTTYSAEFPKINAWFKSVSSSPEFSYIEAINNRTKHTADISNKLSMGLLGSANNAKIGPFFRKEVQHKEKELSDQLQATIDFLKQSFSSFMQAFSEEFVLDIHTENRRHSIGGVYQQRFKDEPDQNLSYAFIPVENDFASMPDELYFLLAKKSDKIYAHICPFEHILVCEGEPHNILGRYVAEDFNGEDCLLGYRKFIKDNDIIGAACLFYEKQNATPFYHKNLFFNVKSVSDDLSFLGRTNLPF